MTDQNATTPPPTTETGATGDAPTSTAETTHAPSAGEPSTRRRDLSAEAASRRIERREAQAERDDAIADRDAARATVSAMQRREVERFLGTADRLNTDATWTYPLVRAEDLWDVLHAEVDTFYDPATGDFDEKSLAAFVIEQTANRQYLLQRPAITPSQLIAGLTPRGGLHDQSSRTPASGAAWKAALSPNR